ncbi:uncharacterized protein [Drosophila suzukii]|uniref:Uncharacterized protein n=1 Tax=Drosophila suzukii TaxID=28584 RepID=A0AB39Z4Y4_DROSZ
MEGPLSFIQLNPACLILIVLGFLFVDFLVDKWFGPKEDFDNYRCYISFNRKYENETPLVRNCGFSYRAKLLASVKRRLDQQF